MREESRTAVWERSQGQKYGAGNWERNMREERGTSERNMSDEYGTGIWWRNLKEEHIYCKRNHGGEILEEKP